MNQEREYKSLEQARDLLKQWGSWGAHRAYLGHYTAAFLYAITNVIGWGLMIGSFLAYFRAENDPIFASNFKWLADGHSLSIGFATIVVLKIICFYDGIRLPTMIYKANAGTAKIVNPITPLRACLKRVLHSG